MKEGATLEPGFGGARRMTGTRFLIVNADDFGQSPGINDGIIQAHERGIVTSTSLMVRWPAAAAAARYQRSHPALSVGLHLDLGEWVYDNGNWEPVYEVVDQEDPAAVRSEILRQLEAFRSMTGQNPSHLDSHQHVHTRGAARDISIEIAEQLNLPLRSLRSRATYCSGFYGQTGEGAPLPDLISQDALLAILDSLPEGYTELGCHPGLGQDLETTYAVERSTEVETLCAPRIRSAIEEHGIRLCSYRELAA